MKRDTRILSVIALVVGITAVILFGPTIDYGCLHWDDELYLGQGARLVPINLRNLAWMFSALTPFYYHPLTWLSYAFDGIRGHGDPSVFHTTNVILHGLNAMLVVALTASLAAATPGALHRYRLWAAASVGLLFAVHPLQVESVAWVAERKTLLCAFFSLVSVCAYLRWARDETQRRWWVLSISAFVAALLSKPMAITLPLALLVLDFYPLNRQRGNNWRRLLAEKWLFYIFSVADFATTLLGQYRVGAVATLSHAGLIERSLIALRGITFYLWKLIWPAWLSPFYPLAGDISLKHLEYLLPALIFLVITIVAFAGRRRAPAILASWLAFLVLLLPMIGLAQVGSQSVADRFVYLAMLAPLLLAAGACASMAEHVSRVGRVAILVLAASAIYCARSQAARQIPVWEDDTSLWTTVLHYYPDCGIANAQLGAADLRTGRPDDALRHGLAGTVLQDDYPVGYWVVEEYYVTHREFSNALPYTARSLAITPGALQHSRYGFVLLKTGHFAEAREQLEQAIAMDPATVSPRYNLVCALSRLGQFGEASRQLDELLKRDPSFAKAALQDRDLAGLRADAEYGPPLRKRLESIILSAPPSAAK